MNFEIKSEEINKFKEISQEEKDFRIKNLKYFNNIGLPSKKLEDWKFTDLREIISNNFKKLDTFQKNCKNPRAIFRGFSSISPKVLDRKP